MTCGNNFPPRSAPARGGAKLLALLVLLLTLALPAQELGSTPEEAVRTFWMWESNLPLRRWSPQLVAVQLNEEQTRRYFALLSSLTDGTGNRPPESELTVCGSHLRNLGTACEMYATDYDLKYPTALGALTPNYLRKLPTCPVGGTYGYESSQPDAYTIHCGGGHPGEPSGKPLYSSLVGFDADTEPRDPPPALYNLFVQEWKILDVQVHGAEARVKTREGLVLDGRPIQVEVEYVLVKRGKEWRIHLDRSAPNLRAELLGLKKRPVYWREFAHIYLPRYGVGGVALALMRSVR